MILSDEDVQERVQSPMNLLNRLKAIRDRQPESPCLPPKSNDIIEDLDDKLSVGDVRKKAASIMSKALDELKIRIPDVQRPEKLAQIAAEMNKVLITRDEKEEKRTSQIIIYAPQVLPESNFETVVVTE